MIWMFSDCIRTLFHLCPVLEEWEMQCPEEPGKKDDILCYVCHPPWTTIWQLNSDVSEEHGKPRAYLKRTGL